MAGSGAADDVAFALSHWSSVQTETSEGKNHDHEFGDALLSLFVLVLRELRAAGGGAASYCAGIQTDAQRQLLSHVCLFFG